MTQYDIVNRLRAENAKWQDLCDFWKLKADEAGHSETFQQSETLLRATIYADAADEIERLRALIGPTPEATP